MKKSDTYFKVYRSLLNHDIWLKEKFTWGQAWVDLIGLANFADKDSFYKGQFQVVRRGQIKASTVWFANRWKWSRNRVNRYFKALSDSQMIQVSATPNGTTITLENYASFQDGRSTNGTPHGTPNDTSDGTTDGTQKKNTIKNTIKNSAVADNNCFTPKGKIVKDSNGYEYFEREDI